MVEITETLRRTTAVEARDYDEAISNEHTPVSSRVQYHLSRMVIRLVKDNSVCAFMPQRSYSISDDGKILHRLAFNPCIHDLTFNYVFQYVGTQGIHHCFSEIHGG